MSSTETPVTNTTNATEKDLSDLSALPAQIPVPTSKIAGNFFSLGACEMLGRGAAFFGTAYLARVLGPAGFGIIGFAAALLSYFFLPIVFSFNDIGAREVARRPHEAFLIARSATAIRLMLACAAFGVLVLVAFLLHKPPLVKLVLVLMGLSFFSSALDMSWVYKGLERHGKAGVSFFVGQVLFLAALWTVVHTASDVSRVPVAQFFGEIVAASLLAVPILLSRQGKVDWGQGWQLLRGTLTPTLARLLRTLIFSFDVVLIGFVLGETQAGLYTAPYRICFMLLAIATTVQSSYLPAFTRAWSQGTSAVGELSTRYFEFSAALSAPLTVGGMVLAEPILRFVFGPAYVESAPAFRLLLLSIGVIFTHGMMRNILLVSDHLKWEAWNAGAAVVLNIGLNVLLLRRYGLAGAAFATVAAEVLFLLLGILAVFRLNVQLSATPLLRPLTAALVMGACLLIMGVGRPLALLIIVAIVTYVGALILLGGVPRDLRPQLRHTGNVA